MALGSAELEAVRDWVWADRQLANVLHTHTLATETLRVVVTIDEVQELVEVTKGFDNGRVVIRATRQPVQGETSDAELRPEPA